MYHFLQVFKAASRQYANSQYKWFRQQEGFQWINVTPLVQQLNESEQEMNTTNDIVKKMANGYAMNQEYFERMTRSDENRANMGDTITQFHGKHNRLSYLQSIGKLYQYQNSQLLQKRVDEINDYWKHNNGHLMGLSKE